MCVFIHSDPNPSRGEGTTKYKLERHNVSCKKSMESLPSEKSCTQCSKTFSNQKALKRHTKVHNKDKPDVPNTTVSCIVCQKTFAKSWNLKRHQQDAHGLTEKGNTVQNSAGMAVFTTEALVKETVIALKSLLSAHFHFSDASNLLKKSVGEGECFC